MNEPTNLERRIRVLEDIEAIRNLKAKWWYSIDHKLWDEVGNCVAEDVVLHNPSYYTIEGRKTLVEFLKKRLDAAIVTVHQGHHHEIEIMSETTARAKWAVRDQIVDSKANTVFKGRYYYDDDFVKENGRWKLQRMTLNYILSEGQKRGYGQDRAVWQGSVGVPPRE